MTVTSLSCYYFYVTPIPNYPVYSKLLIIAASGSRRTAIRPRDKQKPPRGKARWPRFPDDQACPIVSAVTRLSAKSYRKMTTVLACSMFSLAFVDEPLRG